MRAGSQSFLKGDRVKRRAFLAGLPALLPTAPNTAVARTAAPAVTVKSQVLLHPRVRHAIDDLLSSIVRITAPASARALVLSAAPGFQHEEWELTVESGQLTVRAAGDRGFVYGLAALRNTIELEQAVPASLSLRRSPYFKVRRWSTAISHDFGSPWDERINLAERIAYIKSEVLPRAADFGMNAVEINGRPGDGWDVDWVISFENYPELARLFPAGERKQRLALVEDMARESHRNLLDVFVWTHELHLPEGFPELYPQVKGTNYPVCLSNEFLKRFIRDKYTEFFSACPSVDGVVLSVNESGQFSLITDAGCQCTRCIRMSQHERLMSAINPVIEAATELKKQLVLRTFQSAWIRDLNGHPELETIRKAYTGLPHQIQIMSKYCPLDFYGGAIADEPLIGAFPNPHLVEFSLDVEWQGRTFIPVLTPDNFKRRIAHAVKKNCEGVVARVDFPFPSMEPEPIFGHPNEFNAWYMGELLWDPTTDIDDSLRRWTRIRYGAKAAEFLALALRKTEAITEQTFFCQGQTLISYHNMIAGLSFVDNFLWSQALSKWDPSKRKLSESFFQPDEELIAKANREKAQAAELASEGLQQIHTARGTLPEPEYEKLRSWFEKLRDSAELWGLLTELYLRHRQVASSPADPQRVQRALSEAGELDKLMQVAALSLRKAEQMEHLHGSNSWPVFSPDRGVSAYEFVHEILRNYISGLTGEPAGSRIRWRYGETVVTEPVVNPESIESTWRRLVELGRPGTRIESAAEVEVHWPAAIREIHLSDTSMTLDATDGRHLSLPLSYRVQDITLERAVTLNLRKHVGYLAIESRKNM